MVILFVTLSIKIMVAIVFGNIVDSDPSYDGFIFITYSFSSAESTLQSNAKSGSSADGKGLCGSLIRPAMVVWRTLTKAASL